MKRNVLLGAIVVLLVAAAAVSYTLSGRRQTAPVCGFTHALRAEAKALVLYCADEQKLPAGVTSHTASATYGNGVILYSLQDGSAGLSVSLQAKPAKDTLANFVPNVIPLHISITTPVGTASMGVSNTRTIISLPTNTNTWILITAPKDYSADNAERLLKTFTAAQ